ncbi:Contains similarity to excision repair protein ERCC5 from Homo sapiens gi/1082359 and contains XPG N-terminal PF/00752 and XPG I-region PF/00867 domains [Arabidopsis thaliana]|nr:Contains similarity to excision repair protein ERCC5 from Homo sapiens gi/1082359 and contains XPG N-terminal PF/00752 and XPG I-region PF/00867 domains [Arabidopsis thaliana]
MGVGGNFWDLLRPYAQQQGFDFLRNKRVAVDLSFWIVQHETAVKGFVLKPHLRLTFFRTINLFSKFGAYPVFVVDGTPSPLKSQARISRFFRSSGIDTCNLPVIKDGVSVERNKLFSEWVRECVELLELLGIPVLKANGEAEALCAQLNSQGFVDACITPDSDAFLFGAMCVIKDIKPNSREPFECYHMSHIESGLGLKRKHLIAISLLVGNDYDSGGVLGIGVDKALRIVREFSEDQVLERLQDIGNGLQPAVPGGIKSGDDGEEFRSEMKKRSPHCSRCGHLGSKRTHFKSSCEHCGCDSGCIKKPLGFRCECSFCSKDRDLREQKKTNDWWIKVCDKIALAPEFPNRKIIELYLSDGLMTGDGSSMSWGTPDTGMLVDLMVQNDNGDCFLLTDECIGLVQSAFPDETEHFLHEKKLRESKKKNVSEEETATPRATTMGVQRSITDFYRSAKKAAAGQSIETGGSSKASAEKKRQATSTSSSNLTKSVRRRLLFG